MRARQFEAVLRLLKRCSLVMLARNVAQQVAVTRHASRRGTSYP